MDAANQQKILGYFIEEAKEHLETLEQGLMDLSSVINDSEKINELFRAAHSVKGGAAMLGYNSIQKVAHRLEDAFKILQENQVAVDQTLESLFLKGYDTLYDLVECLQSPSGLSDEQASEILQKAEPNFVQLQDYLKQLVDGGTETSESAVAAQAKTILQEMLQQFKKKATPESRKELKVLGDRLLQLAPENENWQALIKTAQKTVVNPKYSYRILAPVIIKELKQGSDLLSLGKSEKITSSQSLQRLAAAEQPQILLPVEPNAAAKALIHSFNQEQLSQLVQLLQAS